MNSQAQTDIMCVQDDVCFEIEEYKVSDILEFDAARPMTITFVDGRQVRTDAYRFWFDVLAKLTNQYEFTSAMNNPNVGVYDVTDFRAVQHYNVEKQAVDSVDYHFNDAVVLHVNADNQLPFVTVGNDRYECAELNEFRLTKNRLNDNITLSGDKYLLAVDDRLQYAGGSAPRLRFDLTLDPLTTYAAEQTVTVNRFQSEPFSGAVGTVLYKPAVGIGSGSPALVIGDAVATDVAGMHSGHYALEVSIAGNRFKNGVVDLADADSYVMHLYDYESGKSLDITSHYKGTITTLDDPEKEGENIYIDIRFSDATTEYAVNYFGPLTTVDDLEGLAPEVTETNNVILTNQSGVQTLNQEITAMQVRESNDGTIYLYMMTDGTRPDDAMQTPCVQISPAHVNAGTLSLPDLKEQWSVSFKAINLAYAKTEWHPAITNGTLDVKKADDGKWDVTVNLKNEYNNMGTVSGTGETLSIHYSGAASAYTGSKK